jgi:hypothetical protein
MKIDVEKIKTAYEAASAEQKEQIEKMFPDAFSAKSKDPEETLDTLVDKLVAWQEQNRDKRAVALFAADKDRTEEEGNTAICIVGSSAMLLNLAMAAGTQSDTKSYIKSPLTHLLAIALKSKIKDNLKGCKHGTDN